MFRVLMKSVVLVFVVLLLFLFPSISLSEDVFLNIGLLPQNVCVGDCCFVPVNIDKVQGLKGIDIFISFDNQKLKYQYLTKSFLLHRFEVDIFPDPEATNATGEIRYRAAGPSIDLASGGTLLTLAFVAISPGEAWVKLSPDCNVEYDGEEAISDAEKRLIIVSEAPKNDGRDTLPIDIPPINISPVNIQPIARLGMRTARDVKFSPDGRYLAVANFEVRLYDATALPMRPITLPEDHCGANSVAFSPDGRLLASGASFSFLGEGWSCRYGSYGIKLWNLENRECIDAFGEDYQVQSLAFSPDGELLASGAIDGIKLWDVESRKEVATLRGHDLAVNCVTFSPDGELLASGSSDDTIRLWNVESRECIATLSEHKGSVLSLAFSPDGRLLASGSMSDFLEPIEIKLWDIESRECVNTINSGWDGGVSSVAFSPDGKILASGFWNGNVNLWDVESGGYIATLWGHARFQGVCSVAFSPDSKMLASGFGDFGLGEYIFGDAGEYLGGVNLWDTESRECIATLGGHWNDVSSVAFSPDGELLASGSKDDTIRLWNIESRECIATLEGHAGPVTSIAFSPDGRLLVSAAGNEIKLWDMTTPIGGLREECIATLEGHAGPVTSIAFSPDGKLLASGSWDKTIKLWNVGTKKCIATLKGDGAVDSVAFSAAFSLLAAGSFDDKILLWDMKSQERVTTLSIRYPESLAFSPDGKLLVSGSGFCSIGAIRLWDVEGKRLITLEGPTGAVYSIAFSPDGKILASGSWDKTIKLWDMENKQCVATLEGHIGSVYSVAFSPDGGLLASGADENTILLWGITSVHKPITVEKPDIEKSDIEEKKPDIAVVEPQGKYFITWASVKQTKLFQNYPNPFNPETWIPYQLKEDSEVVIRIYSPAGNLVRELDLGHQPAGLYLSPARAAHWDGRDKSGEPVASGVYFYQLLTGDFTATKKLVIIR